MLAHEPASFWQENMENVVAVVNNYTMSFSENVKVAETSYQMLEVLSLCDRQRV